MTTLYADYKTANTVAALNYAGMARHRSTGPIKRSFRRELRHHLNRQDPFIDEYGEEVPQDDERVDAEAFMYADEGILEVPAIYADQFGPRGSLAWTYAYEDQENRLHEEALAWLEAEDRALEDQAYDLHADDMAELMGATEALDLEGWRGWHVTTRP